MNIFKRLIKRQPLKPKERVLYAITGGTYLGAFIIFVTPKEYPKDGIYAAIAMGGKDMDGGMEIMEIPEKDVTEGLKLGLLDKIRTIPQDLYLLCCGEYKERVKRKTESIPRKTESIPDEHTN